MGLGMKLYIGTYVVMIGLLALVVICVLGVAVAVIPFIAGFAGGVR